MVPDRFLQLHEECQSGATAVSLDRAASSGLPRPWSITGSSLAGQG